jgi:Tol biopolymer transport system component
VVENADIWRVALDPATGVATGALERVTDDVTAERLKNVSANGRLVAFLSSRTKPNEPWLKDMQTGRQWRLRLPGGVDGFQISPDGSRVAVNSTGSAASPIEIIPTNGGPSSAFCHDCGNIEGWSGDGSRLLVSKGDPSALFIYGFASTTGKALVRHDTWNLFRPRFSPDGRWVVFHTTNSLTLRQIYVVPATRDEPVPFNEWIPIATDFGMQPSWSPDGRGIYYFSDRDGAFCLYLQPLEPATKRPIGEPRVARHFHDPRLRPVVATAVTNDAQSGYLYVSLTETTGNIWLLKNR